MRSSHACDLNLGLQTPVGIPTPCLPEKLWKCASSQLYCMPEQRTRFLMNPVQSCLKISSDKRILRLSRFHSRLSVKRGLSWPSTASMQSSHAKAEPRPECSLWTRNQLLPGPSRPLLACRNIYNLSLVQQCIFLDSKLDTDATTNILNNINDAHTSFKAEKKVIASTDIRLTLDEACKHQSGHVADFAVSSLC